MSDHIIQFQAEIQQLRAQVAELKEQLAKAQRPVCEWRVADVMDMYWTGSCGARWLFDFDGPKENHMDYCPNCGGKVEVKG